MKIFAIYSQFLSEFTPNFKDADLLNSLPYSPMCDGSIIRLCFFYINNIIFVHVTIIGRHLASLEITQEIKKVYLE